jgi:hypothetical protein
VDNLQIFKSSNLQIRKLMNRLTPILASILLLAACQKEIVTYNDGYDDGLTPHGAPTITKIVLATDTASDPAALTNAAMGDVITILGENLSQVKSIAFNGIEVDPKLWYAVNAYIVVPIPRVLLDDDQVTNKVIVTTSKGTAQHELVVEVPRLIVEGLFNEFAQAGDTVQVLGKNFDLFEVGQTEGDVSVNGTAVTVLSVGETALQIIIPADTPDSAIFEATSDIAKERNVPAARFSFREQGISLNDQGEYKSWGENYRADGTQKGEPKPCAGISWYFRVASTVDNDWYDFLWAGGLNVNAENVGIFSALEGYELRFEMLTMLPLSQGTFAFEWAGTKADWVITGGLPINTNGTWKTMRLNAKNYLTGSTATGSWNNFAIMYSIGTTNVVIADFSMSNIRLVKKIE